jgi:voltage-gated potassium channel
MPQTAPPLVPVHHRHLVAIAFVRPLVFVVVLFAAYWLLPLDGLRHVPLLVVLGAGLLLLASLTVFHVRAILKAAYPAVRAVEALTMTVPCFLLLFAATYFIASQASAASFNMHVLTRTDALYFTVATFGTVGFGDIVATSQGMRLLVTAQMVLDLVVLGLVARVFVGAVRVAWTTSAIHPPSAGTSPDDLG